MHAGGAGGEEELRMGWTESLDPLPSSIRLLLARCDPLPASVGPLPSSVATLPTSIGLLLGS